MHRKEQGMQQDLTVDNSHVFYVKKRRLGDPLEIVPRNLVINTEGVINNHYYVIYNGKKRRIQTIYSAESSLKNLRVTALNNKRKQDGHDDKQQFKKPFNTPPKLQKLTPISQAPYVLPQLQNLTPNLTPIPQVPVLPQLQNPTPISHSSIMLQPLPSMVAATPTVVCVEEKQNQDEDPVGQVVFDKKEDIFDAGKNFSDHSREEQSAELFSLHSAEGGFNSDPQKNHQNDMAGSDPTRYVPFSSSSPTWGLGLFDERGIEALLEGPCSLKNKK